MSSAVPGKAHFTTFRAFPEISGAALIERLSTQAQVFEPQYHLSQQVTGLSQLADNRWQLTTDKGVSITARVVVLAAGVGALGPKRPATSWH